MARMVGWGFAGAVVGFLVIFVVFLLATEPQRLPAERGIWAAFSFLGAIPVSAMFSLFAGVSVMQAEIREMRREFKHWESRFEQFEEKEKPSTQFKPGSPPGRT